MQGHLSASQEAALRAMRDWFPASAAFHTDHDLLRFLRARDFHLDAARTMYQNYLHIVRAPPRCRSAHDRERGGAADAHCIEPHL